VNLRTSIPRSSLRARPLLAVAAVASALLLAGCGQDNPTIGDPGAQEASQAQFNDADVDFVAGMRPHHEQAVEMADLVLASDPPTDVARLAERIKADQQPEIEQLDAMLDTFGKKPGAGGHGGHGGGGGTSGHEGMMSEQEMAALGSATGEAASRMFLELMIVHHEGAISASETELREGKHEPALELARKIRQSQQAEIAQMRQLLTKL
jgi:uncharacterized protein (DUF305 family)